VSSDRGNRDNRDFAGKLNDPGKKNGKLPEISQKEGKSVNFHSVNITFEKVRLRSPFWPFFFFFFLEKNQKPFFFNFQKFKKCLQNFIS